MASAVLVAPEIPLDSRIVLNPINANHPFIQEYMQEKDSVLQVTQDGRRIRLESNSEDVYSGFDAFLKERQIDITDPNALDIVVPIVNIPMPIDPDVARKRQRIAALRKAIEKKNWDPKIFIEAREEPIKEPESKTIKFKAIMLYLYNTLKKTASFINNHVISPLRRTMYKFYNYAVQPIIDWTFGEINYDDSYSTVGKHFGLEKSASTKQSVMVAKSNTENRNEPAEVIFSRSACGCDAKKTAATTFTFQSKISANNGNVTMTSVSSHNAIKPKVN